MSTGAPEDPAVEKSRDVKGAFKHPFSRLKEKFEKTSLEDVKVSLIVSLRNTYDHLDQLLTGQ